MAADALAPLRTLLDVLSGEVTRLRKVSPLRLPEDDAVAVRPAPAVRPVPVAAPAREAVAAPMVAPAMPPPPSAVASRGTPVSPGGRSRYSALVWAAVLAAPVLVLGAVFLDRVPEPNPMQKLVPAIARAEPAAARPLSIPSPSIPSPSIHAAAPAPILKPVITKPAVIAPAPNPVVAAASAKPAVGAKSARLAAQEGKPAVVVPAPRPAVVAADVAKPAVKAEPVSPMAAGVKPTLAAPGPKPAVATPVAAQASAQPKPVRAGPTVIGPEGTSTPADTASLDTSLPATPPLAPAAPPAPTPAANAVPPAVAASPARALSHAAKIAIRATADAWVSLLDANGTVVLSRLLHAGDTLVPPAPGLMLTTGNAGGTELVVNGVAGPPLGASGVVRHGVPLVVPPSR